MVQQTNTSSQINKMILNSYEFADEEHIHMKKQKVKNKKSRWWQTKMLFRVFVIIVEIPFKDLHMDHIVLNCFGTNARQCLFSLPRL